MQYLLALIVLLIIPFSTIAQGEGLPELHAGWYGGLELGPTLLDKVDVDEVEFTFKPGFSVGGVVGYEFERFRVETELTYQQNRFDDSNFGKVEGDASLFRVMLNSWFRVFNLRHVTYYLGGGIGSCKIRYDITSGYGASDSDSAMAYQFGVMSSIPIGENGSFDMVYRYLITDFEPLDTDVGAHVFGFRFLRNF